MRKQLSTALKLTAVLFVVVELAALVEWGVNEGHL